ncbi:HemK family protein methyltransferase [bacterium]|nr:HemK family protein methyltransferase [bacterium]
MTSPPFPTERWEFLDSDWYRAASDPLILTGWDPREVRQALLELWASALATKNVAEAPWRFKAGCDGLLEGRPLQHLSGRVLFDGLWLKSDARALIPRPETEEMVVLAASETPEPLRILDAMTGSGCLALSLARRFPRAEVQGFDVSKEALELAKENAEALSIPLQLRVFDALNPDWSALGRFDLIVSNPPYIPQSEVYNIDTSVLNHEPHSALFVPDAHPLLFVEALRDRSLQGSLNPGGLLWIELHPPLAAQCIGCFGDEWKAEIRFDLSGKERFLMARLKP